jgi:hypothetical protein
MKQKTDIEKRNSIIPRVNSILNEIAESTNGARANNYIGGSKHCKGKGMVGGVGKLKVKKNLVDPMSGTLFNYVDNSLPNMARVENIMPSGMGMVGGKTRKVRKDKGTSRNNSWFSYVQKVSKKYGIPYNEALKRASELRKQGVPFESI